MTKVALMGVDIRLARPLDGRLVAGFRVRSRIEHFGGDPAQFAAFLDDCAGAYERGIAAGNLVSWLAFDGADAVGTATLQTWSTLPRVGGRSPAGAERDGRVRNVYVVPEYRRRGIAAALMRELLSEALRAKIDRLALGTSEEGRPLYGKLGFVPKDDELVYLWGRERAASG